MLSSRRLCIAAFTPLTTVVVGLIARPILYAVFHEGSFSIAALGLAMAAGVVYDALVGVLAATPLTLALAAFRLRVLERAGARFALFTAIGAASVFGAFVEWFFFEEFNSRFNNIAIDYVRNPKEVFGNIGESYHVTAFVVAAVVGGMLLAWLGTRATRGVSLPPVRFKMRAKRFAAAARRHGDRGGRARSASVRRVGRPHRQRDRPERLGPSGARGAHRTAALRRLLPNARPRGRAAPRGGRARRSVDRRTRARSHRRPVAPALGRRRDRRRELRERVHRRARTSRAQDEPRLRPVEQGRVALDESDRDRQSHRARIGRHALLAGAPSRRGGAEADEERDRGDARRRLPERRVQDRVPLRRMGPLRRHEAVLPDERLRRVHRTRARIRTMRSVRSGVSPTSGSLQRRSRGRRPRPTEASASS